MDKYILIGFIISIVKLVIGQLIYWDATKNKIGRRKDKKEFLNIPAGAWGFLSIIGILSIPTTLLYIVNRKKLIEKALIEPVSLSLIHRIIVHILLLAIPITLSTL